MRTYSITRPDQLVALASPVRQEIVDVLAGMPPAPIAAIAAALGRPANGLYYHVRELVRVGLVLRVGGGRGRGQAHYRTVARALLIAYDPSSSINVARVSAAVGSMLRLGARDFRRGFSRAGVAVAGPRRELWAGRVTGWLTASGVARANRLLRQMYRLFRGSRFGPRGRLFGITLLLVPLERRPRRHGKERSHAKRR
jgi:Helix-turn-helix domain